MIDVSVQDVGNAKVLSITGDVDLYSSPEVRKELMALTDQKVKNILVDLNKVSYMDSSGVATLVEGLQQIGKYKGKLALFGLHSVVKRFLNSAVSIRFSIFIPIRIQHWRSSPDMELITRFLAALGRPTLGLLVHLSRMSKLGAETLKWMFVQPFKGYKLRLRSAVDQGVRIGWDSIPIVSVIAFSLA